jgi:arylsulfatase A-like enzyme
MQHFTRRQFCRTAAAAAGLGLTGCLPNTRLRQPDRPTGPNIIYILADDLGYADLSCYGQAKFTTPNIDKLATEGLKFTQHYAGSTVCAPSRCSLMTGLHTGHCQIRGNKGTKPEGQWPLQAGTWTVARMLQNAGYATGAFGKWGLGSPAVEGSDGDPNSQGFKYFFGYNCQSQAHKYYPRYLWRNRHKVNLPDNDPEKQSGQYAHDLIVLEAFDFIQEHRGGPFFVYLPVTIPHAELTAPADSLAKYEGKYPEPKPFTPGNERGYGTQMQPRAAFAAMVDRLDGDVGRLLDLLKELGIDDNTIVMFSSDNGPHREGGADPDFFDSNGPMQGYKRDLYEGGIRVPMLVRWPGKIAAGGTTEHISAFWDVLPTLAELAGVEAPAETDGISFAPTLLRQGEQKQHEYLYWEFHEQGGKQAVRMGPWKGVRLNVMKSANAPIELYDLLNDLGETRDLAAQHPEVVAMMADIMQQAHEPNQVFPFFSI